MGLKGCCGQPASRRKARPQIEQLPDNPAPKDSVDIIYLGSGQREVRGSESGLRYYVGDSRRHFRADQSDVDKLLRSREFMLKV
jgi:hypothetical protein